MAERKPPNVDLAAYLLGQLEPGERARVEQELAADRAVRADLDELEGTAELLKRAAPAYEVPAGLEARTFRALERAIAEEGEHVATADPAQEPRAPSGRRRWWHGRSRREDRTRRPLLPRVALAGGLAVVLAAAVFAGAQLSGEDGPPGMVELTASLTAPSGQDAEAVVRETGIGRVISFDSSDLPILPKGDYYELWFVGPGDSATSPDRISAGTFHPDPEGESQVRFAAAVDPAKYPTLAVTAEEGDGNPAPTRPDVLRSEPGEVN